MENSWEKVLSMACLWFIYLDCMEKSRNSNGMIVGYPLVKSQFDPENDIFFSGKEFLATPMNFRVYVTLPEGNWAFYIG